MTGAFPELTFSARDFTPEEWRRAQLAVCSYADSKEEAAELLTMLGLIGEEEPAPVEEKPTPEPAPRLGLQWASWMERAACAGDNPNLWTSDSKADSTAARATCLSCPVRKQCGEYAAKNKEAHGVWGGAHLDELTERRDLYRRHGIKTRIPRQPKVVMCACGAPPIKGKETCASCRDDFTTVDAAQAHLRRMRDARWTRSQMVAATGVSRSTINAVLAGTYPSMRREVADAILAVEVPVEVST